MVPSRWRDGLTIPDWWEALLLSAAAWRTFQLLSSDDILDRPRRYVVGLSRDTPYRDDGNEKLQDFIECPYCLGFWVALAWWGAFQITEHWTLVLSVPLALSAGVIALAKLFSE